MKARRLFVSCLLVLIIIATSVTNIFSYTISFAYAKFSSSTINYRYVLNGNYVYTTILASAATTWTGYSDVYTSRNESSYKYTIYSDDYGNVGWAGYCYWPAVLNVGGYWIKINDYCYVDSNSSKNTVLHEMGHMFGLAHSSTESSVMHPHVKSDVLNPNNDDVNGVNSIY